MLKPSQTFVTLKDILVYCDLDPQETKYNDLFNILNARATEKIQKWTGRDIFKTQYCEYYDILSTTQQTLQLEHYPIISVEGITDNDSTLTSSQYNVYKDEGKLRKVDSYWYIGDRKVRVTYTAGFADIPYCVQNANLEMVRRAFDQRLPTNIKQFSGGGISWTKADSILNIDADIASDLSHLRRLVHTNVST